MTDSTTRSRMMASIRSKNTGPELLVRHGLHRMGLRFRLHGKDLPGQPDLILPRWQTVIFVHGCFWHGHNCPYFHWPRTRQEFWHKKISDTQQRDQQIRERLQRTNWRVLTVWECAFRGKPITEHQAVLERITHWILNSQDICGEESLHRTLYGTC